MSLTLGGVDASDAEDSHAWLDVQIELAKIKLGFVSGTPYSGIGEGGVWSRKDGGGSGRFLAVAQLAADHVSLVT